MRLFIIAFFSLLPFYGISQTDIPKTKPLIIKGGENQGASLKLPPLPNIKNPDFSLKKEALSIQMLPSKNLIQAGYGLKLDPKIKKKEKKGDKSYYPDMYLGDIKSNSKFVGIVYRDYGTVDGDRIKIYANEKIVEPNIFLTAVFKGTNIDLKKGFNRIEFEAINQGSLGPNTAQINVYDEKGLLLYSNSWNLSTGSKATFIIVKE